MKRAYGSERSDPFHQYRGNMSDEELATMANGIVMGALQEAVERIKITLPSLSEEWEDVDPGIEGEIEVDYTPESEEQLCRVTLALNFVYEEEDEEEEDEESDGWDDDDLDEPDQDDIVTAENKITHPA